MNKLYALLMVCITVFVFAAGGCKKADDAAGSSINVDAITEDNALEEADKVLEEIDKL